MDGTTAVKDISEKASASGMNLTEFLRANYSAGELDRMQDELKKELAANRKRIGEFRRTENVFPDALNLTEMDPLALDLMQADANAKLQALRGEMTGLWAACKIPVEGALA